jgi:hypothetical protein
MIPDPAIARLLAEVTEEDVVFISHLCVLAPIHHPC